MVQVADGAQVPAARSSDVAARAEKRPVAVEPDLEVAPERDVPPDPFTVSVAQPSERTARRHLTDARAAASQARRFLTAVLGEAGVSNATVHDAHTLVSEFVIEALGRGRPPRTLDVTISETQVRIELAAEGRCEPIDADVSRQIRTDLVARVAASSGTRPIKDGRVWWGVLEVASPVALPARPVNQTRSFES